MKSDLMRKFQERRARVAVIGMGYVGLPLAVNFARAGYDVVGIDIDASKVDSINRGESYIEDVPSEELMTYLIQPHQGADAKSTGLLPDRLSTEARGTLFATTDNAVLAECDAVSICVPTPLSKTGVSKLGDPDISYIVAAAEQVARYLHTDMVIVLESTTYPGTSTEVLLPILQGADARNLHETQLETSEQNQPRIGVDFFVAFSPERVDPGREDWTTRNTPKVIGGVTSDCLDVACAYYGQAMETLVPVSSTEAAEMVKLFENTFRSVNIGLANEFMIMCDKLDLNAWEVLEAAASKPFGFMKFTPGPGLGGHCIPVDPHYLAWKMRTVDYRARFIELASEINTEMPRLWVQRVQDTLNEAGKPVNGSRVLVLGVAYKRDVSDVRESPALDIIHLLEEKGAIVDYHDPHVPAFHHEGMEMVSVSDLDAALQRADCVIVVTDHSSYDWDEIAGSSKRLVDTRYVIHGEEARHASSAMAG